MNISETVFQKTHVAIGAYALVLLLTGCGNLFSDDLNTVPGDKKLGANELSGSGLESEESFLPVVESITPYDICPRSGSILLCNEKTNRNNTFPAKDEQGNVTQVQFNAPVRFVVKMNKPVYLDKAAQARIGLENAGFLADTGDLRPLTQNANVDSGFTEENDDDNLNALLTQKHQYFTTQNYKGHIQGITNGEFTITIPQDFVYDVDVNNNKAYNKAFSATFSYDTSVPRPTITLIDNNETIVSSGLRISPNANNYGELDLIIDWGEEVTPSDGKSIAELIVDEKFLYVECDYAAEPTTYRKCTYFENEPETEGSANRVARRLLGTSSAKEYHIRLSNIWDVTADNNLRLYQDGTRITFQINEGQVTDLAGNKNEQSARYTLTVDATEPELSHVEARTTGVSVITSTNNSSQVRVAGIGDILKFRLKFSEPITVRDSDAMELTFAISGAIKTARIDASELNTALDEFNLTYEIGNGDGDNELGSNVTAYKGERGVAAEWTTDINNGYRVVIDEDNVYDRVLLPVYRGNLGDDETGDRYFSLDQYTTGNEGDETTAGAAFASMHVDGTRPRVVAGDIVAYMKRLSGDRSRDSDTVTINQKLAIGIPFNEDLITSRREKLDFSSDSPWEVLTLRVDLYDKASVGRKISNSLNLAYDSTLTTYAQGLADDPAFLPGRNYDKKNVIVFSTQIDSTFERTGGIQIVSLNGAPGGVQPEVLEDKAGNTFDEEQANSSSIQLNESGDMIIDGGAFAVASVFPMYNAGTLIKEVSSDTEYQYYTGDGQESSATNYTGDLYIGVQFTRDIYGNPEGTKTQTNPDLPIEVDITLQKSDGTEETIQPDQVSFAQEQSGAGVTSRRDRLVFRYSLAGTAYEDDNGVEIQETIRINDAERVKDENDTVVDATILENAVRGDSRILRQMIVDNKRPVCNEAYLTSSNQGNKRSSVTAGTGPGASGTLYFVVECDQRIQVNRQPGQIPFVYAEYGPGTDRLSTVFQFQSLANADRRLLYAWQVPFGATGAGGAFQVGQGVALNKYIDAGNNNAGAVNSENDFFTDPAGNKLFLDGFTDFLVNVTAQDDDATGDGLKIDTRAYPIQIAYPLPSDTYYQENNEAYLVGNDTATPRSDDKNTIAIDITYGYEDSEGRGVSREIQLPDPFDASLGILAETGQSVGGAQLVNEDGLSAGTLRFRLSLDYTTDKTTINKLVKRFTDSTRVNTTQATSPYTTTSIEQYLQDGNKTNAKSIDLPINTAFTRQVLSSANTDSIERFRVNNARPELQGLDSDNDQFPIEILVPQGNGNARRIRLADEDGESDEVNYGNIYFVLLFDKDVDDSTFADTTISMKVVKENSTDVSIPHSSVEWVARDTLADIVGETTASRPNAVFYRYNYILPQFQGDGFAVDGSRAFLVLGDDKQQPEDIYGNYLDATAAFATANNLRFPVLIVARSDVASLATTQGQEFYKYGDTLEITAVTSSAIGNYNLGNDKLALRVNINEDEHDPHAATRTILMPHVSITQTDPIASNTAGSTTINFSYAFDSIDKQFDDDATSDSNRGIEVQGIIQRCDSTLTNCQDFIPRALGFQNGQVKEIRDAVLQVGSIPLEVGVNTILTQVDPDIRRATLADLSRELTDVVELRYVPASGGDSSPVSVTTPLRTGDTLEMIVNLALVDIEKSGTTFKQNKLTDKGAGAAPAVGFQIYNLSNGGGYVSRSAGYDSLVNDGTALKFTYVIQEGDVIRAPGAIPTGTQTEQSETVLKFNLDSFLTGANNANNFPRFVDEIYGSPLTAAISNPDELDTTIDYADMRVDTRIRVTNIAATTPADEYSRGKTIQFRITFSEAVTVSPTAPPTVRVEFSVSGVAQNATYVSGSGTHQLVFQFTSPGSVNGSATIAAINVNGNTQFIRSATGIGINIDTRLDGVSPGLSGISFNTTIPMITGVTLTSGEGDYIPGGTSNTVSLSFVVDPLVQVQSGTPRITVMLDTKAGGQETVDFTYTGGNALKNDLVFTLDVGSIPDTIQDLDGMTLVSPYQIQDAMITDAAGNPMDYSFDSLASTIEGYDVKIDTSPPRVAQVRLADATISKYRWKDNSFNPNPGFSDIADEIQFTVEFDETVDFNPFNNSFSLQVTGLPAEATTTSATLVASGNPSGTDFTFRLPIDQQFVDFDGIDIGNLILPSGSTVRDLPGNDALLTTTSASKSIDVSIDSVPPEVTDTSIDTGFYGTNAKIRIELTFDENIGYVAGSPKVTVAMSGNTAQTGEHPRTFAYKSHAGRTVTFEYAVEEGGLKTTKAQIKSPITMSNADYLADAYGNRVVSVFTEDATVDNVEIDASLAASINEIRLSYAEGGSPTTGSPQAWTPITEGSTNVTLYKKDILRAEVEFSENVTVIGTPSMTFTIAGKGLTLDYQSGNGTQKLVFQRSLSDLEQGINDTLMAPDSIDGDIRVGNDPVGKDISGSNIIGNANNDKVLEKITINTIRPTISNITLSTTNSYRKGQLWSAKEADTIFIDFSSDENIAVVSIGSLSGTEITVNGNHATISAGDARAGRGSYVVSSSDTQGRIIVSMTVVDENGNASNRIVITDSSVDIDTQPPRFIDTADADNTISVLNDAASKRLPTLVLSRINVIDDSTGTANSVDGISKYQIGVGAETSTTPDVVDWRDMPDTQVASYQLTGLADTEKLTPDTQYITYFRVLDNVGNISIDKTTDSWRFGRITNLKVPTDATYGQGSVLEFAVTWDTNVTVPAGGQGVISPTLTLQVGSDSVTAHHVGGSGDTVLFQYTVEQSHSDTDGITIGALAGSLLDVDDGRLSIVLPSVDTSKILIDGSKSPPVAMSADDISQLNLNLARTEAHIQWDPKAIPAGSYVLEYRLKGAATYDTMEVTHDGSKTLQDAWITGLTPDLDYDIRIAIKNNNIRGDFTDNATFSTKFNPRSLGARLWFEAKDISEDGPEPPLGSETGLADGVLVANGLDIIYDKSGNKNHARHDPDQPSTAGADLKAYVRERTLSDKEKELSGNRKTTVRVIKIPENGLERFSGFLYSHSKQGTRYTTINNHINPESGQRNYALELYLVMSMIKRDEDYIGVPFAIDVSQTGSAHWEGIYWSQLWAYNVQGYHRDCKVRRLGINLPQGSEAYTFNILRDGWEVGETIPGCNSIARTTDAWRRLPLGEQMTLSFASTVGRDENGNLITDGDVLNNTPRGKRGVDGDFIVSVNGEAIVELDHGRDVGISTVHPLYTSPLRKLHLFNYHSKQSQSANRPFHGEFMAIFLFEKPLDPEERKSFFRFIEDEYYTDMKIGNTVSQSFEKSGTLAETFYRASGTQCSPTDGNADYSNTFPHLQWWDENPDTSDETQSFAIIAENVTAKPANSEENVHLNMFNIPTHITEIAEQSNADLVSAYASYMGRNGISKAAGWAGPCVSTDAEQPSVISFKVYALNAFIIDGEIIDPAGGPVWTQQDFEDRIEDSVNVGVDILDTFEVKAVAPIPTTN